MVLYIGETRICPVIRVKGRDSGGQYLVTVIDYDGKILKQDHLSNGDKMFLPPAPTHTGMVFQGWSCADGVSTDSNGDKYVTVNGGDVTVGAYYNTSTGNTEFDIELTSSTLTITCKMVGTKDWGDGTSDNLTTHTYANAGKYTISCSGTSWGSNTSSSGLFGQSSTSINYTVKAIRIGSKITNINSGYAFQYLYGLKTISISKKTTTTMGSYIFRYCINLQAIVLPEGIKTINSYGLYYLAQVQYPVIPSTITSIGTYALSYMIQAITIPIPNAITLLSNNVVGGNSMMGSFRIPSSCTQLGTSVFSGCTALQSLKFPATVTTIGGTAFTNTRGCQFDFTSHASVPTLGAGAFNGYYPSMRIYVPSTLYNTWKSATNWISYQNNIVGV